MIITEKARKAGWDVVFWKPPQEPFICELVRRIVNGYIVGAVLWSPGGLKLDEWHAEGF